MSFHTPYSILDTPLCTNYKIILIQSIALTSVRVRVETNVPLVSFIQG